MMLSRCLNSFNLINPQAWDLLGINRFFQVPMTDQELFEATQMAQLIAILGQPPSKVLHMNPQRAADFFDEHGVFNASVNVSDYG